MTLDVYAGLFPDDLDSVAEALDVLMTQAQLKAPTPPVTHQPKALGPDVDGPSRR